MSQPNHLIIKIEKGGIYQHIFNIFANEPLGCWHSSYNTKKSRRKLLSTSLTTLKQLVTPNFLLTVDTRYDIN